MKNFKKVLIHRLIEKGIEPCLIPGFVRVLTSSLSINPHLSVQQANKQLKYLGWDNFKLDFHTLSLAIAWFEEEGFDKFKYIPPRFYQKQFDLT